MKGVSVLKGDRSLTIPMTAIDNQNPDQQYDLGRNKLQGKSEMGLMMTVEAYLADMISIQKYNRNYLSEKIYCPVAKLAEGIQY